MEYKGKITFKGNPLTLVGDEVKVGDKLPDVSLTANNMEDVKLSAFKGNILIICSVPSLDTPVCDMETRWFSKEAEVFGKSIKILTVSMDLPFAQARWCGAAGVQNVQTLSDFKSREFGNSFGVYIKELGLLARAIFLADKDGVIRYTQLVGEVTKEPDYDAVLNELKKIMK